MVELKGERMGMVADLMSEDGPPELWLRLFGVMPRLEHHHVLARVFRPTKSVFGKSWAASGANPHGRTRPSIALRETAVN